MLNIKSPSTASASILAEVKEEFAALRSSLRINKNDLDEECIRQPVIYQELSEAQVEAAALRDSYKESLSRLDARLAVELRSSMTKAGDRFSETKIGDQVLLDARHQQAYDVWAKQAARVSYLGALVSAADHRGKMLRELGQLFVAGYFSRATSGASARDTDAALAAQARAGMARARSTKS